MGDARSTEIGANKPRHGVSIHIGLDVGAPLAENGNVLAVFESR